MVDRLHAEFVKALTAPDVQKRLAELVNLPTPSKSPEEFAALIASERERHGKIVKSANIKADRRAHGAPWEGRRRHLVRVAPAMHAEHDAWHSFEHLPERMGVPGFRRGRRAAALDPDARQARFVLYEIDDISVSTSAPYLERLNNPTIVVENGHGGVPAEPHAMSRSPRAHGAGVGPLVLAIRLAPQAGARPKRCNRWLGDDAGANSPGKPGVVAAHLLQQDADAARPLTTEEKLRRGGVDESVDWVVLAEGYDGAALQRLADGTLSPASLAAHGAAGGAGHAMYALAHLATPGAG